jgi:glycosyltransferase involved in cell wall biosynthesis
VPPADIVIATAWETAEWVAAMPVSAGAKYYLIQQYEAWTDDIRERVDRTWRLPLRKIVIAGWLARLARERFGESVWAHIPNGVDCDRFRPPATRPSAARSVGMIYETAPWKGAEDGIVALWAMHRAEPALRFVLFGRHRLRHRLPPGTRYVQNPRQADLPEVYRSCDIFLNSSRSEGFSLVTLEAMACGCALVATSVGEVPEMGRPGEDYIMVPPADSQAMAREATALVREPERLHALAAVGVRLAGRFSWERATDLLEAALDDPRR